MDPDTENTARARETAGKPPPRWFIKLFARINRLVYRLSGGRWMNAMGGTPICLVTMTGAKSGRRRTLPLMYVPHGEAVILVASLGGMPKNPLWYYNLLAHPDVIVEEGGRRRALRARLADAEEKARLWPICVERYPPFAKYQRRTTRDIPVFVCEPEG